ncbi:hypothetical protein FH609_002465 [Streptomyces sp. 3MP-14]|uniref:Uncharacterized protein n=1 Tax=Streptomyces mimosae TaxID=2586635 RepID=A0A5N6ASX9_9ACTN|nr:MULTISPECIES: hypothetical protein [Streptomyces]KAB8170788.1 hypothetical protein FH607_000005 [Streptomyces mimosae]KAB8179859.1 hypothetical protein FH609_002465 [Streptomyces sp. 3MP-14]
MIFGLIAAWATCLVILVIPEVPTRFAKLLLSPFHFGDPEVLPMKLLFRNLFILLSVMLLFWVFAELFPDRVISPDERSNTGS